MTSIIGRIITTPLRGLLKVSHTPYSKPQTQRIGRYPLLCLDIDGVCAPVGQNPRFHCHGWPPGFVDCGRSVQIHPALPRWVDELEAAFETVCWISSWKKICNLFAERAGLPSAMTWAYVDTDLAVDAQTGIGRKLGGLAELIDPAAPLAVVDDHLAPQYLCDSNCIARPEDRGVEEPWGFLGHAALEEINEFLHRPGPTLLIAPASEVGLTRTIIELLCRFAQNPEASEFAERKVFETDTDWWVQWPAPLNPSLENPVRIEPEDPEAWLGERIALIDAWKNAYR